MRHLFQRDFHFELSPNREVEPLGGLEWRARGYDPHFVLKPVEGVFPSGWVMIKTRIERINHDHPAKLYVDAGDGMREDTAIMLPVGSSGQIEELVDLPPRVRSLRWDPMEAPGPFSQHPIVISRISIFKLWPLLQKAGLWRAIGLPRFFVRAFARHEWLYKELSRAKTRVAAGTYQQWIKRHALRRRDRAAVKRHIAGLERRPLISILMPVYNPSAAGLRDAIKSVRAQLYPDWQLCIADDASTEPHVRPIIEEFRVSDPRIKAEYRSVNGHISAASNSALALAEGEFIALLDHDDLLSEDALYQVAVELNRHPNADIVYSDEDKIYDDEENSGKSKRADPHFKSDWNPDLLYSQNYISHLGVYRAALVKSVSGFREGFEGSQDYDLLLRCLAARENPEVRHIPAVLYHWRASSGSTALDADAKDYATEHGIKALKEHFRGRGNEDVLVEPGRFPTTYHVQFPLPEPAPRASIIIPTRNHHAILRQCIDSIRAKTTYPNYEIMVIDNLSDDEESLRYFAELEKSGIRVLRYDLPFNYSAINNFAVQHVDGTLLALLNNDIEVITPDWLTEMASHALRPDIGAVGAKLYYGNDTIQHAGVIVGLGGVAGHSHKHLPRENPA